MAEQIPIERNIPVNDFSGATPAQQRAPRRSFVDAPLPGPIRNQFQRGLAAGTDSLQGSGYGFLALLGSGLDLPQLRDYGLAGFERNEQEAAAANVKVSSLAQIENFDDLFSWAGGSLGQAVPSLATAVAGGGAGAVIGRAVAKRAISNMVAQGVEKTIAERAVTGALADQTRKALMLEGIKAGVKNATLAGAGAGGFAASAVPQQGALYTELLGAGVEDDQAQRLAWGVGAMQGALDILPQAFAAKKLFGAPMKDLLEKSLIRGIAGEIAKQGVAEGVTEGAQEALSVMARMRGDKNYKFDDAAGQRILDAMAAGAIVGVTIGGGTGSIAQMRANYGAKKKGGGPAPVTPPPAQEQGGPATEPGTVPQQSPVVDAEPTSQPGTAGPAPQQSPTAAATPTEAAAPSTAAAKPAPSQQQKSAEPIGDIDLQMRDLADPNNPRKGVLLSTEDFAANPALLESAELKKYGKREDADGRGGVLVGTLRTLQWFDQQLKAGVSRDELIGRITRAGTGLPQTDNPAVVQQKDEEGNVAAETVVDGNDQASIEAAAAEYEQEGRTVEVNTPDDVLARREAGTTPPAEVKAAAERLAASMAAYKERTGQSPKPSAPIDDDGLDVPMAGEFSPGSNQFDPSITERVIPPIPRELVPGYQDPRQPVFEESRAAPDPPSFTVRSLQEADPSPAPETAPAAPTEATPTDFRVMDAGQFAAWLQSNPELLDEDNDAQSDRDARAQFMAWMSKGASKEVKRAYIAFKLSTYRNNGSDASGNDIMNDETDDLIDSLPSDVDANSPAVQNLTPAQREDIRSRLEARVAAMKARREEEGLDEAELFQYGMSESDMEVGQIIGRHGWIHGLKRVRSKSERLTEGDSYVAMGWTSDDAFISAETMAKNLAQVDPDAYYEPRLYTRAEAKVRGLAVPEGKDEAWFVVMAPKESAEQRYSKAYGGKLTVAGMVRTALTRGLKRWNVLGKDRKNPKPGDPRHGLDFLTPEGKTRTIASREITILGAQLDPSLNGLENANERGLRAFFQGVAAMYGREGGDIAWRPAIADPMGWLTMDTVIRESNGKVLTLGRALSRDQGSDSEVNTRELQRIKDNIDDRILTLQKEEASLKQEIAARQTKRAPVPASLQARVAKRAKALTGLFTAKKRVSAALEDANRTRMWLRFQAALKTGAPSSVAQRASIERDVKARQAATITQRVIEGIETKMAALQDAYKQELASTPLAERAAIPAAFEGSQYNRLRRRKSRLLARLEKHVKNIGTVGFDLSESTKALQRATAEEVAGMTGEEIYKPLEEIETALEHTDGDMVLSRQETTLSQANRSAKGAELIGDDYSKRLNNSAIGTFAPADPRAMDRANAETQESSAPQDDTEGFVVEESNDVDVRFNDAMLGARFTGVVSELRSLLGLDARIMLTDSRVALVEAAQENGDLGFADEMFSRSFEETKPWGTHWNNGKGLTYIWLNPDMLKGGTTYAKAFKVLGHELGHAFYQQYIASASPELRTAMDAAFARFKRDNPARVRMTDSRGDPMSHAGQFEEWFADQVASWVATDKKPRNLVEQFFSDLAAKLKSAWEAIRKAYPLDESVEQFITAVIQNKSRKISGGLDSFGVANDIMFDTDSLLDEPTPLVKKIFTQYRAFVARSPTTEAVLDNLGKATLALHDQLLASIQGRVHRYNIPAFSEIIKMFYKRAGDIGGFVFNDSVSNRLQNFKIQYDKLMAPLSETERDELMDILRDERDLRTAIDPQLLAKARAMPQDQLSPELKRVLLEEKHRVAIQQFRAFTDALYKYQLEAGLPIAEVKNYFPQVGDILELQAPDAIDTIYEAAKKAGRKETREQIADVISNLGDDTFAVNLELSKLEDTNGNMRAPFAQALRTRVLDPELRAIIRGIKDDKGRSRFYDKSMDSVMFRYMHQAVLRSEYNKILGDTKWQQETIDKNEEVKFNPNRRLNELIKQADEQGADSAQVKLMYDVMDAFLGRYNRIASEPLRKVTRSIAFYSNLRTLMLVTLSSLGEFTMLFLATGNFPDTWQSVRKNAKEVWMKGGDSMQKLRILGFAVDELDALGLDEFKQARDFNSKLEKWHAKFFRMIGLTKWTNWMRGLSMHVSMDYIKGHAQRMAANQDTDGDSKRRLDELGISPEDVKIWMDTGERIYGDQEVRHEDLLRNNTNFSKEQLDAIQRVTGGIVRMVNQTVIHPTAAMKPLWRSDERFMLVSQLGSYTYGFMNVALGRVFHEATRNGATTMQRAMPLIALAMMVPIVALGLELRELVQYDLWGKPAPTDSMDGFKYMRTLIGRTGAFGLAQLGMDAGDAAGHGRSPIVSMLGPTLNQVNSAFEDIATADRTGRQAWKTALAGTPLIGNFPGVRDALTPE